MLSKIIRLFKKHNNYPIPGEDAQWLALCSYCDDMTLHVSKNGLKNGNIQHCFHCGLEKEITGFSQEDIKEMITRCKIHWNKFPLYPYKKK